LDQAVKNEASLAAMRERLEKAESDRVPLTIVYALIALLLACVAALAYFLSRRPKYLLQDAPIKAAELPNTDVASITATQTASEEDVRHAQAEAIDVNLLDLDEASFGEMMGAKPGAFPVTKSRHHNFNADSLVDLRQQAEFLAKLGKVDEALQVLERAIQSNPVESPLLYLDLLVIANNFSRKTDFHHFRTEFVALFNAEVPEFALFRDEGRKLDAYPALLDHLRGQWESPNVLDVIEACILRDPDATESDPFDLAAFRELLDMHAAATELHHINTTVP
jgi:tetratricopeptide (TPR) repeat protein